MWGVMFSLIGSTTLNVGLNTQKAGHRWATRRLPPRSPLREPLWWLGMAVFVVGNLGDFVALGFAPQSIIAPLGSVSLLANALIAPRMNGEAFAWTDGVAVGSTWVGGRGASQGSCRLGVFLLGL